MRILIVSDTHGNYPLVLKACDAAAPFDLLVHLGDGSDDAAVLSPAIDTDIVTIAGNCDPGSGSPREQILECGGKRLLLVHGDAYGVKSGYGRLEGRARDAGADITLFGHTHHAGIFTSSGILFINPGTLSRDAAVTTCALLELSGGSPAARIIPVP